MATHIAALRDKRAKIKADMQAVLREADANEGDAAGVLTDDQAAAFAKMREALAQLESTIAARSDLLELERRSAAAPIAGDPRFAAFAGRVSISDAIAATLGAETRGAGMAREASQEIARVRGKNPQGLYVSLGARAAAERRDVLTSGAQGTPPTGAALIPTIVRGDLLIDFLRANLVLEDLGATFITGLVGNISIPRTSQGTSVGWFAENAPIPDASLGFDAVTLQVKHVGAIATYSRNMLLNSNPDIDNLIKSDLMRALAVEMERAALAGSGDGIVSARHHQHAGRPLRADGGRPDLAWRAGAAGGRGGRQRAADPARFRRERQFPGEGDGDAEGQNGRERVHYG